ncbi:DNA-directed RNA polymerase subunit {ECO:0000256/PIRNR:PIRNR005586} [Serendipita indica DSM 11827]|uniref:DNA-directed RNA polymerase subunit n=1 Tax=Serendipita indica (strain DSM 11827) TaxID=1109443 RepID=G4T8S3_SERID|nr:DNA-directed RNA polymerase subunit {ECO:0000256/PIRNR:PIRNR005586} [Serendipita indica DSM 11827]CCA67715.1 probable RPA12-13.7 kD subunit of DNA-directed RNA polymerase I [Serendipita indica DSM 11827]
MSAKQAKKIGSLLFCPECGTLLDYPEPQAVSVKCEQCGYIEPASSYDDIKVVTQLREDAFPSELKQRRKMQTRFQEEVETRPIETITCKNCGHDKGYTMEKQLRSADEGSTIFTECVRCGFLDRLNN